MKNPKLTPEKLLNKKFKTELSGYRATDVDQYFDLVIEDYKLYLSEFKKLSFLVEQKKALIEDKDDQIEKLIIEIANLKDQVAEANKNNNYELVKKIEELTKLTKSSLK